MGDYGEITQTSELTYTEYEALAESQGREAGVGFYPLNIASKIVYYAGSGTYKVRDGVTGALTPYDTAVAAIQAAYDAMSTTGGNLLIRKGTYAAAANTHVYPPDNVTTEGEDRDSTIVQRILFTPQKYPLRSQNIKFKDFTVDLVDNDSNCLDLMSCDHILIDNMRIKNGIYGLYNFPLGNGTSYPSYSVVRNSIFENNHYGMFLTTEDMRGYIVEGCTLVDNREGIEIEDRTGDVHVSHCLIKGLGNVANSNRGMLIAASKRVSVSNCSIFNNGLSGISIQGSGEGTCEDVDIHDNFIFFNGQRVNNAGVTVLNGYVYKNLKVHHNWLYNNKTFGIDACSATAVEFYDCHFDDNICRNVTNLGLNLSPTGTEQAYGIAYNRVAGSNYNSIFHNDLRNNATGTLEIGAQGLASGDIVRNNFGFITEAQSDGIIASGDTSVVITHGCSYSPAAHDITITQTNSPSNDPGFIYITDLNATTFTVRCLNNPGVSTLTFEWSVRRI